MLCLVFCLGACSFDTIEASQKAAQRGGDSGASDTALGDAGDASVQAHDDDDAGGLCASAFDCDDGIECTEDACLEGLRKCRNAPRDADDDRDEVCERTTTAMATRTKPWPSNTSRHATPRTTTATTPRTKVARDQRSVTFG